MKPPIQSLADALERDGRLDPVAARLSDAFDRAVGPGPLKDAISGTWFGHALHPPLTAVTIGAWTSASVLDMLGDERGADALVGFGVLTALPTIVTGLNEMTDTPGRPKRIAVAHGLANLAVASTFALSWVARKTGHRSLGRLLSMAGGAAVSATAALGGHLSFVKGVGVNETAFEKPKDRWTAVMPESELPEGKLVRSSADGIDIVLYRTPDRIYALSNTCTHRGGPLDRGPVRATGASPIVTCPWHGSQFRLEDGRVMRGPATAPEPAFLVRVEEGRIEVRPRPD
jgi:nitrite reductase/ring-hydroxylating ferredoxin subunit